MTYPGGQPGGYPGPGPQQPQQHAPGGYGPPPPSQNPLAGVSLAVLLSLGVTLLGLVAYFCGFSDEAAGADSQILLLLVAGLLAAFRAIPDGPKFLPVAAVLSVAGGLWMLDAVIGYGGPNVPDSVDVDTPGIVVVLLIMGILQMLVAVAALLFDYGIIKMPVQKPYQYGPPSGQFPQQGYGGQPGAQTQYQPQPGQFPPPGQPGTPPGGYPQQG
jgi:hypothetical protein